MNSILKDLPDKRYCINYNNCRNPKLHCSTLFKNKNNEWEVYYSECCMDKNMECLSYVEGK